MPILRLTNRSSRRRTLNPDVRPERQQHDRQSIETMTVNYRLLALELGQLLKYSTTLR